MIEKIIKLTKSIDGSDTIEKMEVCKRMIDNFMLSEKPKDKRIHDGLQAYYINKLITIKKC